MSHVVIFLELISHVTRPYVSVEFKKCRSVILRDPWPHWVHYSMVDRMIGKYLKFENATLARPRIDMLRLLS